MNEKEIIEKVDAMCIESLSPESMEAWDIVKEELKLAREDLK